MAHDVYKKLSAGMDQLTVRYESIVKRVKSMETKLKQESELELEIR